MRNTGVGADGGIRTRTVSQRCLRPQRLPFRHARQRDRGRNNERAFRPVLLQNSLGAEDGIRTRDLLLGKEMLYH
jgi:hypothetical protein